VEDVCAFAPDCNAIYSVEGGGGQNEWKRTEGAIVPWDFTRWTAPFIRDATDATDVAFVVGVGVFLLRGADVPPPLCDGVPVLDYYFHGVGVGCA
jgi:hypothetical protein